MGLGFYTYISYRFVIFILGTTLFCWWQVYKKENLQKKFIYSTCWLLFITFIVALPIGIYFLLNPNNFFGRAAGVSVFACPDPIYELGKSFLLHLQMFNFYGDGNWRHNWAGSPILFWPIGIFFLIGIIFFIKEAIISIKNKNYHLVTSSYTLLVWFGSMLLPGALSSEGVPHALRVIGTIPVVYVFAGIGASWLYKKLEKFYKAKNQKIVFGLIIFLLFFSITYAQFDKYFFQWAKKEEVKNAFSLNYVEIGRYLNSLPNNVRSYVIVNQSGVPVPFPNGLPMPAQTPIFIERTVFSKPRATYLKPEDLDISYPLKMRGDEELVYIPLQYDKSLIKKLKEKIPNGILKKINNFWIYEVRSPIVP